VKLGPIKKLMRGKGDTSVGGLGIEDSLEVGEPPHGAGEGGMFKGRGEKRSSTETDTVLLNDHGL